MKKMRLPLLLAGLLVALSVPVSAVIQCTQTSCDAQCGGHFYGKCIQNRCYCT
jgi:hypothetical protein